MKKFKYIIVSPASGNGGSIALHALCKCLNDLGENAMIFYPDRFYGNVKTDIFSRCYSATKRIVKKLLGKVSKKARMRYEVNAPIKCRTTYFPRIDKNTIVVYPEIVHGNILNAKNVVRWLLWNNRSYRCEGEITHGYEKDDLFFCYREVFNDPHLNPTCRKLHVASFDFETYKRYNFGERKGKCYILRKGRNRSDLPHEFDGPIIDELTEKEKVKFFNECEYCISYDTQTAYSQIAALCGCVSIVVPEHGKNRNDYRTGSGSFDSGIGEAFGFLEDEIQYSRRTMCDVLSLFKESEKQTIESIKDFVGVCEDYFNCEGRNE